MLQLPSNFFNHDAQAGGFYPMAHVGIDIQRFGQKQNVLIEGIRGTGKTHILRMLERYYLENFETFRVLPVYVSLAQISEHAKKNPDEFRLHLYVHLVEKCVETAQKYQERLNVDTNLIESSIHVIAELFGMQHLRSIDRLLVRIRKVSEDLKFQLQFDLTGNSLKTGFKNQTTRSAKLDNKIDAKVGGFSTSVGHSESDSESKEQTSEEAVTFVGNRLAHKNASLFVMEFLKQIQVVFNLDHVLVLVDECSEAKFDSQVEIFRLFKTIRGADTNLAGKDSTAFFVGTVYPRGETYYPTREVDGFLFQPGQDCTVEFTQWDETDIDAYIRFFQDMTYSRAKYLAKFDGTPQQVIDDLFDSQETFLLAAFCSHGIPRRYWELLKQSYDGTVNKVTLGSLDIAIQEIVNNQLMCSSALSEADLAPRYPEWVMV